MDGMSEYDLVGMGQIEIVPRSTFLEMKLTIARRQWRFLLDERSATHLILLLREQLRTLCGIEAHEEEADQL